MLDAPAALKEQRGLDIEPANGQLDAMPVSLDDLAHDLGIVLFPNAPTFGRRALNVEAADVGTVGEATGKDDM